MKCTRTDYFFAFAILCVLFCVVLFGCSHDTSTGADEQYFEKCENSLDSIECAKTYKVYW